MSTEVRSEVRPCQWNRSRRRWRIFSSRSLYARSVSAALFRFRQFGALVRLGRPLFLTGGFVLYGLGAAIAVQAGACVSGAIDWRRFGWGQIAITATQLMTHYCNDYCDYDADRANTTPTRWSGGSRVLPAGELPRAVALVAALTLGLVALLATAQLVTRAGASPGAAVMLVLAIVLSWEYSAPPLRLHSTGWGELNTALVVTLLTPLIGFHLQADRLSALPVLAVLPLCCLQFAMLLAIELPDAAGDAACTPMPPPNRSTGPTSSPPSRSSRQLEVCLGRQPGCAAKTKRWSLKSGLTRRRPGKKRERAARR